MMVAMRPAQEMEGARAGARGAVKPRIGLVGETPVRQPQTGAKNNNCDVTWRTWLLRMMRKGKLKSIAERSHLLGKRLAVATLQPWQSECKPTALDHPWPTSGQ